MRQLLGQQFLLYDPPKPRGQKVKAKGRTASKSGGAAAATKSGGASCSGSSAALQSTGGGGVGGDDDDVDEVEMTGERTWEERDTELRKHAILLE